MTPRRSIILIYYREPEYFRQVVTALEAEFPSTDETEIIVVDNYPADGVVAEVVGQHPRLRHITSPENLFYGKGANLGLQAARGEWMMILNVDVRWDIGALRHFVADAETDERVAMAGPLVLYADGRVQVTAHHRFPNPWTVFVDYCLPLQQYFMHQAMHPHQLSPAEHAHRRQVAHLTGVCLYLRRLVYDAVGGFDPAYTMYLEETDWQRRLQAAGYSIWLLPSGSIVHYGSAKKTFAQASPRYLQGVFLYARRWWRGPFRSFLLLVLLWIAWAISLVTLMVALFPSLVKPSLFARVRHYLTAYWSLGCQLTHPTFLRP